MSVRLPLSAVIYPPECVEQAIVAYGDLCGIEVSEVTTEGCFIDVRMRSNDGLSEDLLVREFLNYLLDLSVENHLSSA